LLFFLCFFPGAALRLGGQSYKFPPAPLEQRLTGARGQDDLCSFAINWRGEIAAIGNATKGDQGGQDISFVVFDAALNKTVERHIGRKNDDGAGQIAVLPDGRYLVAGYSVKPGGRAKTRANYFGKKDGWLLLLDERGETEREILMGTSDDDTFTALGVAPDGGVWLAGNSQEQVWLVRLDRNLNLVWEKRVRYHQLPTRAFAATLTPDGHFFVLGDIKEMQRQHLWVAGFDPDGVPSMEKIYPSSQAESGTAIIALQNKRLAIIGDVSDPRERENGFLSILDRNGVMLHYRRLGGREFDHAQALLQLRNGSLLVGGGSASFERGSRRLSAWLNLLSDKADLESDKYYGSKLDDEVLALAEHPDGRLLAIGATARQVLKMRQGWLFQLSKRSESYAPNGDLSGLALPVVYPDGQRFLEKNRSYLPIVLENKGKTPQYNLRAVLKPKDPTLLGAIKLPGIHAVMLPPIAAGDRISWGLPFQLTDEMPAGEHGFEVQFFQADRAIGPPQVLSVQVGGPMAQPEAPTAQTTPVPPAQGGSPATNTAPYTVAIWVYPNPDNFERPEIVWTQEEITVQIKIVSNQGITKQQVCLEINGEPCPSGAKFDEVQIKGDKGSKTMSQTVRLRPGENLLRATIQTANGPANSEPLKILYAPAKPNLHIVSIGVPASDLKYTSKDARDFAEVIARNQNKAFEKIFLDTLLTEERTTKTEILKALRRLQYRYTDLQILPKDLLVIFVSGHGLGAYDGSFRLAAGDYDAPFLQETSLDFEQDVVNYLQTLPCQKIFFVDACHSGTTSGTGLAGIAARKSNLNMLVSCQSDEFSYEDDAWQNGAFTHALVRGIETFMAQPAQIDQNADAALDLRELFDFIRREVPSLVNKKRPKPKTEQMPNLIMPDPNRPVVLFGSK
jgi:hypothetical protein